MKGQVLMKGQVADEGSSADEGEVVRVMCAGRGVQVGGHIIELKRMGEGRGRGGRVKRRHTMSGKEGLGLGITFSERRTTTMKMREMEGASLTSLPLELW